MKQSPPPVVQDSLASQLKAVMEASGFAYLVAQAEAWILEMGAAFLCEILQEFSAFADDLGMHPDDKEARNSLFCAIQHEAHKRGDCGATAPQKPQVESTAELSDTSTVVIPAQQLPVAQPRTPSQLQLQSNVGGKLLRGGQPKGMAPVSQRRQRRRVFDLQTILEERPEDVEDMEAYDIEVSDEVVAEPTPSRRDQPNTNDQRIPLAKEVDVALQVAGLAHCGSKANAWCKDMGAAFVQEILEEFDDFANCLDLPMAPDPARAVLAATLSQRLQALSACALHAPWLQHQPVSCM